MKKNKRQWQRAVSIVLTIFCLIAMSPLSVFAEGSADAQSPIRINEVDSDPNSWLELMNTGEDTVDLSGWEIRDNSDDHRWRFASGTELATGAYLAVDANTQGQVYDQSSDSYTDGAFGGAVQFNTGDSVRLYNKEGVLVDSYEWEAQANVDGSQEDASWGRYPNGTGSFQTMTATKGQANVWVKPSVVINEVESNGDVNDWVEIYNTGNRDVDISGWYLMDNDPDGHKDKVKPLAKGTILRPGECFVFEQGKLAEEGTHFDFGLGDPDSATIYNADGVEVAKYEWTTHATGVYARIPDGTGELVDTPTSTKGALNVVKNPVVINEVESKDPNDGPDWVELANPTDQPLDISGLILKDNDDSHAYTIPENTIIPANGFKVLEETTNFDFGLSGDDSVRIFEGDTLLTSTAWTAHATTTWGLYPDAKGKEYRDTKEATKGSANKFADTTETIAWPGSNEETASDLAFLEDSSGLDFYKGQLYAVDNGTGTFWVLDVAKNGTLSFANGFENGKVVNFKTPTEKGPDAEGITVDGEGNVYLASERNNSDKDVNYNTILKADVNGAATQNALQQWDITNLLPSVETNKGIEAVEWVSNSELAGKLYDKNTGAAYDPTNYPNAIANGIFFVAMEANGYVYGLALNDDETATVVAEIDSKLGGAMSLDYDTYEKKLWVGADDGYANRSAQVVFNGTNKPDITHVAAQTSIQPKTNTEGFAIASPDYTVNNNRPVYRFIDGIVGAGDLTIGSIYCDKSEVHTHSGTLVSGKPATATEDGWHDYYSCTCGAYFEDQACTNEITDLKAWQTGAGKIPATSEEAGPTITEGNNSTWTSEAGGDLTFKSDADIADFKQVLLDGKVVDAANYTVAEGSIVVTLKEAFLKTLSGGKHTISIVSATGTATASFEVKADGSNTDSTTPDTGDTSNIYLWMFLLAISGCDLAGAWVLKQRKVTC